MFAFGTAAELDTAGATDEALGTSVFLLEAVAASLDAAAALLDAAEDAFDPAEDTLLDADDALELATADELAGGSAEIATVTPPFFFCSNMS